MKPSIDAYLAEQPSFPIVEDSGAVHFVYRGEAEDVDSFEEQDAGLESLDPLGFVATDYATLIWGLRPIEHWEWDWWFTADAPPERPGEAQVVVLGLDDPRIAVALIVENGESGSGVAAPIARAIMDAHLGYGGDAP